MQRRNPPRPAPPPTRQPLQQCRLSPTAKIRLHHIASDTQRCGRPNDSAVVTALAISVLRDGGGKSLLRASATGPRLVGICLSIACTSRHWNDRGKGARKHAHSPRPSSCRAMITHARKYRLTCTAMQTAGLGRYRPFIFRRIAWPNSRSSAEKINQPQSPTRYRKDGLPEPTCNAKTGAP